MKFQFNPIGWCHLTVNFWWGCAKVSPACAHCYAEMMTKLFSRGKATWGPSGLRWIRTEAALKELRAYDAKARELGVRWRIFINSMSDTFEDRRDLDEARAALFAIAPTLMNLDLLLLTKRPENILRFVPVGWHAMFSEERAYKWPANVWVGTTVEDQKWGEERINYLLRIPAAVRFLSCEPLLGPIDIGRIGGDAPNSGFAVTDGWGCFDGEGESRIHWIICGGESGPQARPMHPAWARSLRDQCAAMGVPFYFKQWGEWVGLDQKTAIGQIVSYQAPITDEGPGRVTFENKEILKARILYDDVDCFVKLGKHAAGRLLDGIEHNGFPQVESGVQS